MCCCPPILCEPNDADVAGLTTVRTVPGIIDTLKGVAESRGVDWDAKLEALKKNHQWHVEVY